MKKDSKIGVRQLVVSAMLSALAVVLMYLEFAIPILIPSFVKLDFSDIPALIGAFALGPVYGVVIELIKNLLHLVASQSLFIGELANFILGAAFTFTAGMIYKHKKTKKNAFLGGLLGAVVMGIVSFPVNMFITYPVYIEAFFGGDVNVCIGMYQVIIPAMNSLPQCLLCFNLPFTIVKGLICVAVAMLIYKPLSRLIKGNR